MLETSEEGFGFSAGAPSQDLLTGEDSPRKFPETFRTGLASTSVGCPDRARVVMVVRSTGGLVRIAAVNEAPKS